MSVDLQHRHFVLPISSPMLTFQTSFLIVAEMDFFFFLTGSVVDACAFLPFLTGSVIYASAFLLFLTGLDVACWGSAFLSKQSFAS